MKHFLAALACLAIIVGCTVIGAAKSTHSIDDILSLLHEAPTNLGEIPPQAEDVAHRVGKFWAEKFFLISIFHPHAHLDEVKEKIVELQSYADTGEYAEWKQAHASLEEELLHLKGLLEANIDNIL